MDDTFTLTDVRTRLAAAVAATSVVAILSSLFYAGFGGLPLT